MVTSADRRFVRVARFDRVTAEPSESAVDPLAGIPAQREAGGSGLSPAMQVMGGDAVIIERQLNEWISFRKPGRYRITAETTRVRGKDTPREPMSLRSAALEIEIVAPEPGWAEARLRTAEATLEGWDPAPPAIGTVFDSRQEQAIEEAARTLRYLETPEAAQVMLRFFERGPQAAQRDLRAGLFGSPHRQEITAAMEEALAKSDVGVTYYWIGTLIELTATATMPPRPLYPLSGREAQKEWTEATRGYSEQFERVTRRQFEKLTEAVGSKNAAARAVSLETLVLHGPQPAPPAMRAALIENFGALPGGEQRMLLTTQWRQLASPSVTPLLRSLAAGENPARDAALLRLLEMAPEEARGIVLDRIRKGDVETAMATKSRALLLLPDETLPELDGVLVDALERGKPVETLIARYASGAILGRVRAAYEKGLRAKCGGPLIAYFFRVDAEFAADLVARERESNPGACPLHMPRFEDLLMGPGLEQAAIEDLTNPDPTVRRSAQMLLQYSGSAEAEQPLRDGMALLGESEAMVVAEGLEFGFVEALLKGYGWILTPEKIDRLMAACVTERCRTAVASERRTLLSPVKISLLSEAPGAAMVGPFWLRTREQVANKIGQFPRGTRFSLEGVRRGVWYDDQRVEEVRQILQEAGMELMEEPEPRGLPSGAVP